MKKLQCLPVLTWCLMALSIRAADHAPSYLLHD